MSEVVQFVGPSLSSTLVFTWKLEPKPALLHIFLSNKRGDILNSSCFLASAIENYFFNWTDLFCIKF